MGKSRRGKSSKPSHEKWIKQRLNEVPPPLMTDQELELQHLEANLEELAQTEACAMEVETSHDLMKSALKVKPVIEKRKKKARKQEKKEKTRIRKH